MKESNRFDGLSKALYDCWEAEKSVPSGVLSTLCTVFNQIYVQGHQYITGKLFDQQTNGDRTRNAKDFWKGRARERGIPRGMWRWTFAQKHFQSVLWFVDPSAQPHGYVAQLIALIDKQKHEAAI